MEESNNFDRFTGQSVGHNKTVAVSSPPVKNDQLISWEVSLKSIDAEKSGGILMRVHGKMDTTVHDRRLDTTDDVITTISVLPISVQTMAEVISLKTAIARYGLEIIQPNPRVAKAFDEQITDVLVAIKRTDASKRPWHCCDPVTASS